MTITRILARLYRTLRRCFHRAGRGIRPSGRFEEVDNLEPAKAVRSYR